MLWTGVAGATNTLGIPTGHLPGKNSHLQRKDRRPAFRVFGAAEEGSGTLAPAWMWGAVGG